MIVFMDGSAQSNPGPIGSDMMIRKQCWNITSIKIAKAVKYIRSSYKEKLEAIKIATE